MADISASEERKLVSNLEPLLLDVCASSIFSVDSD